MFLPGDLLEEVGKGRSSALRRRCGSGKPQDSALGLPGLWNVRCAPAVRGSRDDLLGYLR